MQSSVSRWFFIALFAAPLFLVGCKSQTVKESDPTPNQTKSNTLKTTPMSNAPAGGSLFSAMLEEADELEEENAEDYELYFFDSRGVRYYSESNGDDPFSVTVERLINDVMQNSSRRMLDYSRKRQLNLALEVTGDGEYYDGIVTAAEEHILSQRRYRLQSQDAVMQSIVSKILKKELDPFYQGTNVTNVSAQASDFILYIDFKATSEKIQFKSGLLSKSGEVLGISRNVLDFNDSETAAGTWLNVKVPYPDGSGNKGYKVHTKPVSEFGLFGRGSKLSPATNMNFEQANAYCVQKKAEPVNIFAFEYARRTRKLSPPTGTAYQELIPSYDSEDFDEELERDGDKLELDLDDEDSYSQNNIIVFDWNTEKYSVVSNAYRSNRMTFRCMTH